MFGLPGSSFFSGARARLRSLVRGLHRRCEVEEEMSEEFRHHIEMHTERLIARGVPSEDAARQARLEFGHVETHKENARASRGLHVFDEIRFSWLDVKLGVRMLGKHPGLTLVALFALAVGIPVGMAPMHLANVLEAPLPEDPADRIRALRYWNRLTTGLGTTTAYELERWSDELTSFAELGATRTDAYNLVPGGGAQEGAGEGGGAASLLGAEVTASTFEILQTRPLLGRTLEKADEAIGAPNVVLLGYGAWQSRLGGDPDILGSTVRVAGVPHTVIGIMPKGFLFPIRQQLWLPLREEIRSRPGEGLGLRIFGRLSDGVSPEEAQAEMAAVGQRMAEQFPETHDWLEPEAVPFAFSYMGIPKDGLDREPGFYFFQLLGLLLLLVACANVAMLLFARTATRFRELAVRSALGASRMRILSQMFAESLVIALPAAAVGLVSADWMLDRVFDYALRLDAVLPYWLDLGISREAIVWALALAILSAVIAGVTPGWRITRAQLYQNIQSTQAGRSGIHFGAVTSALVVADVAIAVTVVGLAAGLANWVMETRVGEDRVGIPAEEFLAAEVRLSHNESAAGTEGYDRESFEMRLAAMQQTLVERLQAEPAVRSVAVASVLPRMDHPTTRIEVEGEEGSKATPHRSVRTATVDLDYFDALDHPILRGRAFDWTDLGEHARTVIVNTDFVDRMIEGRNPIGLRIRLLSREPEDERWYEIVGVVGSLGMTLVHSKGDAGIYFPAAPGKIHPLRLAIHVAGAPEDFTPRLRELVREVDWTAVLSSPKSLDRVYQGDWYLMLAVTGGLLLLLGILIALAASGIFAMMSFVVVERTPEIGIRSALGAHGFAIVSMVLKRSFLQIGLGASIGLPLAFLGIRGSFETPILGLAVALAAGTAVITLIGLIACTAPTLRALAIEPSEALRSAV